MADVTTIDVNTASSEELVSAGIKAYILRDYNAAVEALSRAIELIVAEKGEKHDSLGNAYLHYGKALLEISREESEALVPQMNDESDDDEDEGVEEKANGVTETVIKDNEANTEKKVEGSEAKTESPSKNAEPSSSENEKPSSSENAEPSSSENAEPSSSENAEPSSSVSAEPSTSGNAEPSSSTSNGEEGESTEDKNEEATDLQVAWEVLELAKIIFEERGEDAKKELADTLVTLGEVSVESENFDGAIADIKQGLDIQKEIFEANNRHLAGTYYKLAVALSLSNKIEESIVNFNFAADILKKRLEILKANEEQNKEEIDDIEALIPEIGEKIADMKSFKTEATNKIAAALIGTIEKSSSSSTETKFEASSSGNASDISHLVKRKRKLNEIAGDCEENAAKKKPDNV